MALLSRGTGIRYPNWIFILLVSLAGSWYHFARNVIPVIDERRDAIIRTGHGAEHPPPTEELAISGSEINVLLPRWFEGGLQQCQLPPRGQFSHETMQSRGRSGGEKQQRGKKIALLLMEYQNVTFPDVWGQYFRDANPSDYVLYIHIQNINIPETMGYHELQSEHRNLFSVHESMRNMTRSIKILKTRLDAHWGHLMPILLSFWRDAIADESVAGFVPLSGSCLPVKQFSYLHQTLVMDHVAKGINYSVLNFANEERSKASAWGFLTRDAVLKMLNFEGGDLTDKEFCPGPASEEQCPSQLIRHLGLPNQHGVVTFDCWSEERILASYTANPDLIEVSKTQPCDFTSVDTTFMKMLETSGVLFARKFHPDAIVRDMQIPVRTYIKNMLADPTPAFTEQECEPIQTSAQCTAEGAYLGEFNFPHGCAEMIANHPSCGDLFMFSTNYPEWGCRCCSIDVQNNTTGNDNWAIFSSAKCNRKGAEIGQGNAPPGGMDGLDSTIIGRMFQVLNGKLVNDRRKIEKCGFDIDCPAYYRSKDIENSIAYLDRNHQVLQPLIDFDLKEAHAKASSQCKLRKGGVLRSGGWCLVPGEGMLKINGRDSIMIPQHHVKASGVIVDEMIKLIDSEGIKSVNDFGSGVGQYRADVTNVRPNVDWRAFDGAGNVEDYTNGFLRWFDLTRPLSLPPADWVFSLEVGEHVPRKYEGMFLRNLHAHNCKGVILSWAALGQGGNSHVNCHSNEYVISHFQDMGYEVDIDLMEKFRARGNSTMQQHYWFHDSVMVFRRKKPRECNYGGKLSR